MLDNEREQKNSSRRLPPWIRVRLSGRGEYAVVDAAVNRRNLNTVCVSADCPNRNECFNRGTATFMILGDICTRNCAFCAVQTGSPAAAEVAEPRNVAEVRDDLPDGGASVFASTISEVRQASADVTIEVLTPDFKGCRTDVETVLTAGPDVFNHNIETVRRLQPAVRPQADYDRSLSVLKIAADCAESISVKSGIMVGLGETDEELAECMQDLCCAGCRLLTIGQYLAPSRDHAQVERFVEPDKFDEYAASALAIGFDAVASGPLVRSSYNAHDLMAQAR
jgi:lipoic acid synthetase